jgi:hypothetical protein
MTHDLNLPIQRDRPQNKKFLLSEEKGWWCVLCCFLADLSSSRLHFKSKFIFGKRSKNKKGKQKRNEKKRFGTRLNHFSIQFLDWRLSGVNNCLLLVCFETIWFCLTFDSLAAKTSLQLERQKLSDFRFGFRFEFIYSFRVAHKYSHEVSLVSL